MKIMDEQGKHTGVQQKIAGQIFPRSDVLSHVLSRVVRCFYIAPLNGFCFQVASPF